MSTSGLVFFTVSSQSLRSGGFKGSVSIPALSASVSTVTALLRPKLRLQSEPNLVIRIAREPNSNNNNNKRFRNEGDPAAVAGSAPADSNNVTNSGNDLHFLTDTDTLSNYSHVVVTVRDADVDVAAKTEQMIEAAAADLYSVAAIATLAPPANTATGNVGAASNHNNRAISLDRMAKLSRLTLPLNRKSVTDRPHGQCALCGEARRPGTVHTMATQQQPCGCPRLCCSGCYAYASDLCSPGICPVCGESTESTADDDEDDDDSASSSSSSASSSSSSSSSSGGGSTTTEDSFGRRGRPRGPPLKVRRM